MKTIFHRCVSIGILTLILGPVVCWAQTDPGSKPEPPPGPLLANAPDPGQWVVTCSYPDERFKEADVPPGIEERAKMITTTRAKDVIHEAMVDASNGKSDNWYIGDTLYTKRPKAKTWEQLPMTAVDGPHFTPLPVNGFRDLDWIRKEAYVGSMKFGDRNCLVFIDGAPPHLVLSEAASQPGGFENYSMVAFIDAETRLPVQVEVAGIIRSYRFANAESDALTLPQDLTTVITQAAKARALLGQRLPRP